MIDAIKSIGVGAAACGVFVLPYFIFGERAHLVLLSAVVIIGLLYVVGTMIRIAYNDMYPVKEDKTK